MKAIRSLEQNLYYLHLDELANKDVDYLRKKLKDVDDQRIFAVAEALRQGISEAEIHDITKIDLWFIDKIKHLIEVETELKNNELSVELLRKAKRLEFPNRIIALLTGKNEADIKNMCKENDIIAVYKVVDTCAAEFDATTPYYYSVHGGVNEVDPADDKRKLWF